MKLRNAATLLILLALAVPALAGARAFDDYRTLLVSLGGGDTAANGNATSPSISLDGSRVSFVSTASNMGPRRASQEVFSRSLGSGAAELLSRADGIHGAPANGDSYGPSSSGSGRIVAFTSTASNLGGPGGQENVYVRQAQTGQTILVSRADGAHGAPANANSFAPSISADGSEVAFASDAGNLGAGSTGHTQIYLRNLETNRTILISQPGGGGGPAGNGNSTEPAISSSGNAVAFTSDAPNLGAGGGLGKQVFERRGGNTFMISRAPGREGKPAAGGAGEPSIDGFGDRVAFDSSARNLSGLAQPVENVYLRDVPSGATILISRSGGKRGAPANGDSSLPNLPRDGRFVCFQSFATNLGNPYDGFGVDTGVENVYVHDTLHHGTFLISREPGRRAPGANGDSQNVSCSAGASLAAFQTRATNLPGAPRSGLNEVYRRTIFGGR
jgi:Tol biopolymer transport system component